MWFKCQACEARREEIDHLRAELDAILKQNELLTKRITELADPGIDRRLRPPRAVPPGQVVGAARVPSAGEFPGYERRPSTPELEVE